MSERPADWSPVGLDVDPTPGDPVVVIQGGQEYLRVAEAIGEAAASAGRLELEGAESQAVDAVMEKKAGVIEEIRKAQDRYRVAGDALVDDGRTLEEVQQETLQALVDARSAQAEQFAAQQQAASFEDQARDVREDDARDELRQDAVRAQGRVEAASVVIAAARDRVADAVATRNASAQRAISRIAEITSGDGLDDGWWDDWGADAVAALASIADVVSQIAGVLALVTAFIPGLQAVSAALFAISAVAGAVSMIANLALAATGEKSWTEVGIAVATSALSVVGLGAAGAGAKLLSKAVLRPSTFNAIQKAVCKLPFGTCFVAGTLIHTPDGPRPIEDLRAGDKVWAHNTATGLDELQLVNETFIRTTDTLYHLTINGHVVTTTAEHPFMVEHLGWIEAQFLQPGHRLVTLDDGTATLDTIEIEHRDPADAETVYNIHVDNHHNYYVIATSAVVLVHNAAHGVNNWPRKVVNSREHPGSPLKIIPDDAEMRDFFPSPNGGPQKGVNFKWVDADGKRHNFRAHEADPTAPGGSNSAEGPIYRHQKGNRWEMSNGEWAHPQSHNPNSPNYNPEHANETHIPWPDDTPLPW